MRRIVIAFMSTLSGLVLLFSYPTSTNRSVESASTTTAEAPVTSSTTGDATTDAGAGSSTDTGSSTDSSGTTDPGAADSGTADSGTTGSGTADSGSTSTSGMADGTWTGTTVSTRFGDVQVEITVSGGTITASDAIAYPTRDGKSKQINAYAVPVLNEEALSAQSASIDLVSGATYTSDAYVESLQSAIDQALA
ncbi:FMN-binding protein [Cellulomonas soli]|uniref:FMN-binding protein n=1 Tax=Cellulomonas soli TaxID=931535 RepID=UPI003F85A86F